MLVEVKKDSVVIGVAAREMHPVISSAQELIVIQTMES